MRKLTLSPDNRQCTALSAIPLQINADRFSGDYGDLACFGLDRAERFSLFKGSTGNDAADPALSIACIACAP
jgi:hypothetical protein